MDFQEVKFQTLLQDAVEVVKKNPVAIFASFVGSSLIGAIITYSLITLSVNIFATAGAAVFTAGVALATILGIIINILVNFFGYAMTAKASMLEYDKHSDLSSLFSFVKARFSDLIKLSIDIFMYTGAWIIIAYALIMGALALLSPFLPFLLPIVGIMGLAFIVVILGVFIMYFKKMISSSFAYLVYLGEEKSDPKSALKRSIEIAESHVWTIFANMFILSIITGIISSIFKSTGDIVSAIVAGIIGAFTIVFQVTLKKTIEKSSHHIAK